LAAMDRSPWLSLAPPAAPSMPIRFACTNCRQSLAIATRKAGTQVVCPKCQANLLVPTEKPLAPPIITRKAVEVPQSVQQTVEQIPSFSSLNLEVEPLPAKQFDEPNYAELVGFDDVSAVVEAPPILHVPPIEYEVPSQRRSLASKGSLVTVSRKVLYAQAILIVVVALVSFGIGYLAGAGSSQPVNDEVPVSPREVRS
jgi:hypothetical protein